MKRDQSRSYKARLANATEAGERAKKAVEENQTILSKAVTAHKESVLSSCEVAKAAHEHATECKRSGLFDLSENEWSSMKVPANIDNYTLEDKSLAASAVTANVLDLFPPLLELCLHYQALLEEVSHSLETNNTTAAHNTGYLDTMTASLLLSPGAASTAAHPILPARDLATIETPRERSSSTSLRATSDYETQARASLQRMLDQVADRPGPDLD